LHAKRTTGEQAQTTDFERSATKSALMPRSTISDRSRVKEPVGIKIAAISGVAAAAAAAFGGSRALRARQSD